MPGAALVVAVLAAALVPAPAAARPAAKPAPVAAKLQRPYSFLRNYTDQLGVVGNPAGTAVTAQSDLYTGWTELSVRVGRSVVSLPSNGRTLEQGRYPVLTTTTRDGPVIYTMTAFAAPVGPQQVNFVRVQAANVGKKPADTLVTAFVRYSGAAVVTHPNGRSYQSYRFGRPSTPSRPGFYFQPGADFNPFSQYAFQGNALLRDGAVLYDFPAPRKPVALTQSLFVDAGPIDGHTVLGQTEYAAKLKHGQGISLDFHMPVVPLAPSAPQYAGIASASFDAYRRKVVAGWAQLLRGATAIDVPEKKVLDTYYASLVNVLLPRYRAGNGDWIQTVNDLRYHAFFLRDGAVMTNALDLAGLHRQAAENLGFFLTWQQPDGLFISRPGQLDGFGQALWAFGEHVRLTNDRAFARRVYPAVQSAMSWFEASRASDPLHLMPAGNPGDNEYIAGHLAGDNFWAYAGVEQAVEIARRLGRPGDVASWGRDLADFRTALQTQARAAAARSGGYIPPALDVAGGQDWGNYWAAYPGQPFAPDDPLVGATLAHAHTESREGIASFGDPKMLHAYLGFRLLETQLRRSEQGNVVRGLYDELAHTTSTNGGFETSVMPFGDRTVDLATSPHGWWAAEYVSLLRNMLVREEGHGVVLMSALSPAWLAPGRTVSVTDAPTAFGPLSFSLRTTATGATLTWRSRLTGGATLTWPIPAGVSNVHAPGLSQGIIRLHGGSGRLDVVWKLARGPKLTFEKVAQALLASYKHHGTTAGAARANAAPLFSNE